MTIWRRLKKADPGSGTGLFSLIMVALILAVFGVVMEIGNIYMTYSGLESKLQRAANSAVEYAMMDNYRADGILQLDAGVAQATLSNYLRTDLGLDARGIHYGSDGSQQYGIYIATTDISASPPVVKLSGEVEFNTIFALLSRTGTIAFQFNVVSKNVSIR